MYLCRVLVRNEQARIDASSVKAEAGKKLLLLFITWLLIFTRWFSDHGWFQGTSYYIAPHF